MPELPSHASPSYAPRDGDDGADHSGERIPAFALSAGDLDPPSSLLSPAFTPATSGVNTPTREREPAAVAVDNSSRLDRPRPNLLARLPLVQCVVRARIPTVSGAEMFLHLYTNDMDDKEHLAIVFSDTIRSRSLNAPVPGETERDRMIRGAYVGRLHPGRVTSRQEEGSDSSKGASSSKDAGTGAGTGIAEDPSGVEDQVGPVPPLVRIHSECYTGEIAWSARCDCGEQLDEAARLMSRPGAGGAIVYLRQEGRGIGLGEKLKAYNLQDLGSDTVEANLLLRHPADARSYGLATAMLMDLGLGGERGIRLLTNNPDKVAAVEGPNREVVVRERVAMIPLAWRTGGQRGINSSEIENYLKTKIGKMGHMMG